MTVATTDPATRRWTGVRVGRVGATGTWPYDEKWFVPRVTLDHVLADRRIGITGYEVFPIRGGDDRAVLAELALPALMLPS
jgi:hypothetical protein